MSDGKEVAKREEKKPALKANGKISAIVPQNLDEAWRLSGSIVHAGMVPSSYNGRNPQETQSKVMTGIMKGLEVGLKPMSALANIMIINNRPSLWGDGAMALVQGSDKYEWHKEWHEGTPGEADWTAYCEFKRKGSSETIKRSFSWGEAVAAKLNRKPGPWMSYPKRMLQMRARAFAIRDGFSDILCGLSIVEEQQDIPQKPEPADVSSLDDDFTATDTLEGSVIDLELEDDDPSIPEAEAVESEGPCKRCGGRQITEWEENGESGIGPCPDCNQQSNGVDSQNVTPESATA